MDHTYFDPEKHFEEQNERLLPSSDRRTLTLVPSGQLKRPTMIAAQAERIYRLLLLTASLGLLLYCAITLRSLQQSVDATTIPLLLPSNTPNGQSLNATIVSSCGASIPEARALGCFFDAMTFQWYPPACADPDLSAEVIKSRDWRFYTIERGWEEDLVPIEDVVAGNHEYLYVPMDYHLRHCTYLWRKMHRAILQHRLLDEELAKYEHTEHCESLLQSEIGRGDMNSAARMTFSRCVVL